MHPGVNDPVHVPCPACGAQNRVPAARLGDRPVCGRCKAPLFGAPAELDGASLRRHLERSDLPVLVDFWAAWCAPCRAMAPQFAAAARELAGKVLLAKLDTERAKDVAAALAISAIPTLILFRGGREVARSSGTMSAAQIRSWLAQQGL